MSQLSVPSAETSGSTPGDATVVGGGSFVTAVASDGGSFVRLEESAVVPASMSLQYAMQEVDDPGVDTGFTLRVSGRWSTTDPGIIPNNFLVQLYASGDPFSPVVIDLQADAESPTFVEIVRPLTTLEVQAFRAGSGFGAFVEGVSGFTAELVGNLNIEPVETLLLDCTFIQLEAPDAGPPPDIEITSDAGLEFGGGTQEHEFTSDAGLNFDFSGVFTVNEFISDAGLELDFGAIASGNAFTSDAGLEFDVSAADIVLSADSSGIYTFVPGQHFDRILARNVADNETVDVEIPRPFGKTAFFNG
jgi:hypothetical protein